MGGTAVSHGAEVRRDLGVPPRRARADLTLEPSVYLESGRLRPRATKQIVLSGRAMDYATRVRWSLAKAQDTPIAVRDLHGTMPTFTDHAPGDPHDRSSPPPPRADFRFRQDRPDRPRPRRWPRAGSSCLSTGGIGQGAARGGAGGARRGRGDGLPRDDGRPGQDAAPEVHGGLLALRDDPEHVAAMEEHGIGAIDLLVVNLYPFEETVAQGRRLRDLHREYRHRRPGDDPRGGQEPRLRQRCRRCGRLRRAAGRSWTATTAQTTLAFRQRLAQIAYARTAAYDAAVSTWMAGAHRRGQRRAAASLAARWRQTLRYGENPHQSAAFYADGSGRPGRRHRAAAPGQGAELQQHQRHRRGLRAGGGIPPRDGPACAIIKHANPCGVARGATLLEAYRRAFDCDRTSAFGGIVALNCTAGRSRRPRRSARSSPRSSSRPAPTMRRRRSLPARRTCAC